MEHSTQRTKSLSFNRHPVGGVVWSRSRLSSLVPLFPKERWAVRANLMASMDQMSVWSRCSPAPSWSRHHQLDYIHMCCMVHQRGSHLQWEKETMSVTATSLNWSVTHQEDRHALDIKLSRIWLSCLETMDLTHSVNLAKCCLVLAKRSNRIHHVAL